MKKLILTLLAIVCVISCAAGLAACDLSGLFGNGTPKHEHEYELWDDRIPPEYAGSAVSGKPIFRSNSTYHWLECKSCGDKSHQNVHSDNDGDSYCDVCVYFFNMENFKPEAESVTLDKTKLTLAVGGEQKLTATVLPAEADQSVGWKSSDNSVVTVDSKGNVIAKKTGTATITAIGGWDSLVGPGLTEKGISETCTVTVQKAGALSGKTFMYLDLVYDGDDVYVEAVKTGYKGSTYKFDGASFSYTQGGLTASGPYTLSGETLTMNYEEASYEQMVGRTNVFTYSNNRLTQTLQYYGYRCTLIYEEYDYLGIGDHSGELENNTFVCETILSSTVLTGEALQLAIVAHRGSHISFKADGTFIFMMNDRSYEAGTYTFNNGKGYAFVEEYYDPDNGTVTGSGTYEIKLENGKLIMDWGGTVFSFALSEN